MKYSLIVLAAVAAISVAGCKASEPFKDAHVDGRNSTPAEVGTMPDGFSNFATKCDHGNRVYVIFHGDNTYGDIDVVPQDPSCRAAAASSGGQ